MVERLKRRVNGLGILRRSESGASRLNASSPDAKNVRNVRAAHCTSLQLLGTFPQNKGRFWVVQRGASPPTVQGAKHAPLVYDDVSAFACTGPFVLRRSGACFDGTSVPANHGLECTIWATYMLDPSYLPACRQVVTTSKMRLEFQTLAQTCFDCVRCDTQCPKAP